MSTDRELLELAAKAIGHKKYIVDSLGITWVDGAVSIWNPLTDDGDALRLAVGLRLEIRPDDDTVTAAGNGVWEEVQAGHDRLCATRRAIVRAAAELGKMKP